MNEQQEKERARLLAELEAIQRESDATSDADLTSEREYEWAARAVAVQAALHHLNTGETLGTRVQRAAR